MEEKSRIIKKLNNEHTRPVLFSESFGGSENQLRLLLKYLPDKSFKDINLILNNSDYDLLEKNRINVLWVQHFVNQKEIKNLGLSDYVEKLDYIVFNSNWNFEKFYYQFKIPESKSLVIKNAIEKIEFTEKPRDKINLIYHTTPWRGLAHLLKVFKNLDFENVELNVCSSTKIYGKKLFIGTGSATRIRGISNNFSSISAEVFSISLLCSLVIFPAQYKTRNRPMITAAPVAICLGEI